MTHDIDATVTRLCRAREHIAELERRYRRPPGSVSLLAVSKAKPVKAVRAALGAGQRYFGESYAQEAQAKIAALPEPAIEWHFIGPLQSNKTAIIAGHFAWVHSVDRAKIAERLSRQRPAGLPPLNVCIQVNISGESAKQGAPPDETVHLARSIVALPGLALRGLMAIPAPCAGLAAQRIPFRQLRELYEEVRGAGIPLDTLSMGMTADLEAAIAEGSTIVRLGTAIFGPRPARTAGQLPE